MNTTVVLIAVVLGVFAGVGGAWLWNEINYQLSMRRMDLILDREAGRE